MNDETIPDEKQKRQWIFEALEKVGFKRVGSMEIFTRPNGSRTLVVDLSAGKSVYFKDGNNRIDEDDEYGTLEVTHQILIDAEDGRIPMGHELLMGVDMPAKIPEPAPKVPHDLSMTMNPAIPEHCTESVPAIRSTEAHSPAPMPELSIDIIKKYINDKATDEEAYVFLQLCKARHLNPFLKQAYLIKYDHTAPASMVVGKDAFMERAELHDQFDGFEAGIITDTDDERAGTFLKSDETLLGGWARVYRKDRSHPLHVTVSMKEYDTGKSSWKKMPATMIRKVALVQALREAFPSELGGMYDQSEMGVDV